MRIVSLLVLVGLVACEKNPPPDPRQPLSNRVEPRPVPAEAPFSSIAGEWSGKGYQPDIDSSWMIVMRLDADAAVGAKVGTIRYPDLGCGGDLVRLPSLPEELRAREMLTTNPDSGGAPVCIDGGTVIVPVTPRTDGTLDWKWDYPEGKPGATATLAR